MSEVDGVAALTVPRSRPESWVPGMIAIEYITLNREDDPSPPCVLRMVVGLGDDFHKCVDLETGDLRTIRRRQLMGVREALDKFDECAEDMTVRHARTARAKLAALADGFDIPKEWAVSLGWWRDHPEDRPDGYALILSILQPVSDKEEVAR